MSILINLIMNLVQVIAGITLFLAGLGAVVCVVANKGENNDDGI